MSELEGSKSAPVGILANLEGNQNGYYYNIEVMNDS